MLKRIIYVTFLVIVTTMCTIRNDSGVTIGMFTINNSSELVYYVKNESGENICLLNARLELFPSINGKKSYEKTWHDVFLDFNAITAKLKDTSEIFTSNAAYDFNDLNNMPPETRIFYKKTVEKIENSSISMKGDLVWELYEFFQNTIFLKDNETFSDTIFLKPYLDTYPDMELKFSIDYPGIFIYNTDTSYLQFFIRNILNDSLGVSFPESLDGYKIVHDIELRDEKIVSAVDNLNNE